MSEKLKIMVAGTANPHIPGYLRHAVNNKDFDFVAVADFDEDRIEKAKGILKDVEGISYYSDWLEMLEKHRDADAIIIGSDNKHHFKMYKEAMRRKLNIHSMKVVTMNEDECA
jgi:predicted dehydrogenase